MKEIDIKDYFIEIIDEGRSTIGYDCIPYKTKELVHKIYKQNDEFKRLEQENAKLKEENEELKKANQSLSMLGTDLASANETVRKEFFRADKNKDMWREKAEEYRFALEKINKIAELRFVNGLNKEADLYNIAMDKIQDKINEVLK